MVDLENMPMNDFTSRLLTVFFLTFVLIFIVAKVLGPERKEAWFKRRTKYTFFNRRGIFGEYINFGYPRTWQGVLVAVLMYGVIFILGFWYIFVHPYA